MDENGSGPMMCRGVRGATTVPANTAADILDATRELLGQMIDANGIRQEDVASVIFSTTPDLNAEFPAVAARQMGWTDVAMLCNHEMSVPKALPMCLRVLIHWNTTRGINAIQHVYIRGAVKLRPDRSNATHPSANIISQTSEQHQVQQIPEEKRS